jgi:hypothetical protein
VGCHLAGAGPDLPAGLRDGAEALVDIIGASTSAVVVAVILAMHAMADVAYVPVFYRTDWFF